MDQVNTDNDNKNAFYKIKLYKRQIPNASTYNTCNREPDIELFEEFPYVLDTRAKVSSLWSYLELQYNFDILIVTREVPSIRSNSKFRLYKSIATATGPNEIFMNNWEKHPINYWNT